MAYYKSGKRLKSSLKNNGQYKQNQWEMFAVAGLLFCTGEYSVLYTLTSASKGNWSLNEQLKYVN